MPTLAPVSSCIRATCQGSANGVQVANVFHLLATSGGTGPFSTADITGVATAVGTIYKARFQALLSANYSGVTVTAIDLTNDVGAGSTYTTAMVGSDGGTTTPASAAACITWRIPRHYRGGHPRTYLGPLGSTAIGGPTNLAAGYVTALQTAATGFLTDCNAIVSGGIGFKLICVHRYRNGVILATPTVDLISSASVDNRIDSQRRRLGPDR
jgi:hypothetical protein